MLSTMLNSNQKGNCKSNKGSSNQQTKKDGEQAYLLKSTVSFSKMWQALSAFTIDVLPSFDRQKVCDIPPEKVKAEAFVKSSSNSESLSLGQIPVDAGVTDDQTCIQLHFVGIRNPFSVSQLVKKFDEQLATAKELQLIAKAEAEAEAETSSEDEEDEEVSGSRHRAHWPVFHQVFDHQEQGFTYEEFTNQVVVADDRSDEKQESTSDLNMDDVARIESGKIQFESISHDLYLTASVSDLKKRLRVKYDIPDHCEILLIYSQILLQDPHRTLKYYGVENNSFILICISERKTEIEKNEKNGSQPVIAPMPRPRPSIEENTNGVNGHQIPLDLVLRRQIAQFLGAPAPAFTKLRRLKSVREVRYAPDHDLWRELDTFSLQSMTDLDIMSFENDDHCIRMPCGHGMVQESLFEYCKMQLKEKKSIIKCPHMIKVPVANTNMNENENENKSEMKEVQCNQEWKYPVIRRVLMAELNNKQPTNDVQQKMSLLMSLELLAARNTALEYYDLQRCGKCRSIIHRKKQTLKDMKMQAECPLCSQDHKRVAIHKFEQRMMKYERKLQEFDRWHIAQSVSDVFSRFSLPDWPTLGVIHQKPIRFYRRSKKRIGSTIDLNEEENLPDISYDFFRTASDSEQSDADSDDSDIHIEYALDEDGYQSDDDCDSDDDNENENESAAHPESQDLIDTEISDESASSSVAVVNIFGNDSSSDDDSSSEEHTAPVMCNSNSNIKSKIIRPSLKEQCLQRMNRLRTNFFEHELEQCISHYSLLFCFGCGTVWSDASSLSCGNSKCSTSYRAQIVQMLACSPTKRIGSVSGVPLTRACVNCCQLIQHWECCKHMSCRQCKKSFCFVCLLPCLPGTGWQCGSSSTVCAVADRQGVECLPAANQSTVQLFSDS